jgi:hypothetical protein
MRVQNMNIFDCIEGLKPLTPEQQDLLRELEQEWEDKVLPDIMAERRRQAAIPVPQWRLLGE